MRTWCSMAASDPRFNRQAVFGSRFRIDICTDLHRSNYLFKAGLLNLSDKSKGCYGRFLLVYTLAKNPAIFCQGVPDFRFLNAFWGHLDKKTRISLSRCTGISFFLMCAPFVGRFNFRYWFCGRGTQQAEQPLGWAAQLAEKRWLAYLPALVPCYTLFLTCLCLMKQSVLNRT